MNNIDQIKFEGITVLCGLTKPLNKIMYKLSKNNNKMKYYTKKYTFIEDGKHPFDIINDVANIIKDLKTNSCNEKILIFTHSPYTLEAIDVYSQYYEIDEYCNYYLIEKDEIVDCKDDIEKMYESFADAFTELDIIKFRL